MPIPLPDHSRNQSPDRHIQISRRFIELAKGDRLQASEKIWGAAGHAIAAIGKDRGWRTEQYAHKNSITDLLSHEFNDPSIKAIYRSFDHDHVNFYQNNLDEDDVRLSIASLEPFAETIQHCREEGPRPFEVMTQGQVQRIRTLSGRNVRIGTNHSDGFVNHRRLAQYQRQWEGSQSAVDNNDDED